MNDFDTVDTRLNEGQEFVIVHKSAGMRHKGETACIRDDFDCVFR